MVLSLHSFAPRNRDWVPNRGLVVALNSEEADEMEDERDDRDTSEIIDSGEEAVEECARDERRVGR
jgi:hypothetical protein